MEKITFVAYDTLCTIRILEPPAGHASSLLSQAKELACSVQRTLNMYDPGSELSRLCAGYTPGIPAGISEMLYQFIRLNLEFSEQTGGAFDFTVGPLVKLWNFLAEHPEIPTDRELDRAMQTVGYRHVRLSDGRREVTMDVPGMSLDPGASGKGFALDLVVDFFKAEGVKNAVLDFGGNLFVLGHKPSFEGKREQWRVGIRHPDQKNFLGSVCLADRGIATSSWYEHSFQKNGVVYHHLLDSRTGKPQETDISSVSILSSEAVYTDLLSTAFFVMGFERGCALAEQLKSGQGIDVDYVVLKKDGSLAASEGACFSEQRRMSS